MQNFQQGSYQELCDGLNSQTAPEYGCKHTGIPLSLSEMISSICTSVSEFVACTFPFALRLLGMPGCSVGFSLYLLSDSKGRP